VESGQTTFVSAALTNDKEGTATNVTYCIYVPLDMGTPTKMSDARLNGDRCEPMEGAEVVQCHWSSIHSAQSYNTNTMKPDNFKDCSFQLNPDTKGAPQKQLALVGKAKFHYSIKTVRKDIPILG
jgi:hypothetical protein